LVISQSARDRVFGTADGVIGAAGLVGGKKGREPEFRGQNLRVHQADADRSAGPAGGDGVRNLGVESCISRCAWRSNSTALAVQGTLPPATIDGAVTNTSNSVIVEADAGAQQNSPSMPKNDSLFIRIATLDNARDKLAIEGSLVL
jgi:hypothetical protein